MNFLEHINFTHFGLHVYKPDTANLQVLNSLGLIEHTSVYVIEAKNTPVALITPDGNIVALLYGSKHWSVMSFNLENCTNIGSFDKTFSEAFLNYSVIQEAQKNSADISAFAYYLNCVKLITLMKPRIRYPELRSLYDRALVKSFIYDLQYVDENQVCTDIPLE